MDLKLNESESRISEMLKTAFGSVVNQLMKDKSVVEIMLNPDGRLWIEAIHLRRDTL